MSHLLNNSALLASVPASHREIACQRISIESPTQQCDATTPMLSRQTIDGFTDNEVRRRLWHILPGLLPFVLVGVIPVGPIPWSLLAILVCLAIGVSALAVRAYATLARDGERNGQLNAMTYSVVPLCLLLLFPDRRQLAAVALVVLAFGDGMATLVGLLWGQRKLPWSVEKTWAGSAAFLLCSGPTATLAYWLWARPAVSLGIAACCGGGAALSGMLVESLPIQTSDNLRVSSAAAVAVIAVQSMLVGWS